jgi:hypothetical protein
MAFQYGSDDRSHSGGAIRVPCPSYFGTVRGLADGEAANRFGVMSSGAEREFELPSVVPKVPKSATKDDATRVA